MANIEDFKKQMTDLGIDPRNINFMGDPKVLEGYKNLFDTAQQSSTDAWNNNAFGIRDAYNTVMTALDWSPWLNGSADYNNALAAQVRTQNDEWFRRNAINNSDEFANRFGVRPDLQNIRDLFENSVDAEYTAKRAGLAQSEAAYQQDLNDIKAETFKNIYNPNAAAATGASLGAQAANAMASAQNFEQEASQKAVQMAQQRENLVAEEAAARAQADLNAEQHYEDLALKVAQASAEYNNPIAAFGTAKYAFDSNNRTAQATESAAVTNAMRDVYSSQVQGATSTLGTIAGMINNSTNAAAEAASTGLQTEGNIMQGMNSNLTNSYGNYLQSETDRYNIDKTNATRMHEIDKNYAAQIYGIDKNYEADVNRPTYTGGNYPTNTYKDGTDDATQDHQDHFAYNEEQIEAAKAMIQPVLKEIRTYQNTPDSLRDVNTIRAADAALEKARRIVMTMPGMYEEDKERLMIEWGLIDPNTKKATTAATIPYAAYGPQPKESSGVVDSLISAIKGIFN